jgi:stage V sporulation protein S
MDRSLENAPRRGDEPEGRDGFALHGEPRAVPSPNAARPQPPLAPGERPHRQGDGHAPPGERGLVLRVSGQSRPSAVAGAIAGAVRRQGRVEVQAIGAASVNQAVKAVAIALGYLDETGVDAVCLPGLVDLVLDGDERTAIVLAVEPR